MIAERVIINIQLSEWKNDTLVRSVGWHGARHVQWPRICEVLHYCENITFEITISLNLSCKNSGCNENV